MCTEENSALSVSNSQVFALSLFMLKAPAAILSAPSARWLMMYMQQPHPSLEEGGTDFVPPSTGPFYFSVLTPSWHGFNQRSACVNCVHVNVSFHVHVRPPCPCVNPLLQMCCADIQSTCFTFPPSTLQSTFSGRGT